MSASNPPAEEYYDGKSQGNYQTVGLLSCPSEFTNHAVMQFYECSGKRVTSFGMLVTSNLL